MTKNTLRLSIILVLTLCCLIFVQFNKKSVKFVWVSPSVNTTVLPYISTTIKKLDDGINQAVRNSNKNGLKMSVLYQNAYGSGFLKLNPIPNDLDYSVGIHLGKYDYDGKNGLKIAQSIEDKMSTFQAEFYDYISNSKDQSIISDFDVLSSIIALSGKKDANINSINSSLNKLFENKEYIIHTTKIVGDKQDTKLEYPFVLKSNEILIEDYNPMQLFTEEVKYSKNTQKFLRETTVVIDFFVDIENTQTKQVKSVEIVSESFVGQRFQLSRRFFVPIVFVGENSAKYLSTLDYLNNDDKYIEYRLFNFKRHLQEFSNLNEFNDRPVKMLKRILQCTELISPVLDDKLKAEIYENISKNLNNRDVQIVNDYSTSLGDLIQITQLDNLYVKALNSGKINNLLKSMDADLKELQSRNTVNEKYLTSLMSFQINLEQNLSKVQSANELAEFSKKLLVEMDAENKSILGIFNDSLTNKKTIISYINVFNDIYTKSGFHKIEVCWLDKNTLGIVKDDFTNKINPKELKQMAIKNGLADVNYKLITKSEVPKIGVRYGSWVRYNTSKQEDLYWDKVRQQLLSDKKNFNIKRKLIIKF